MASDSARVVGLVAGSHLVNHAYLILLPPAFPFLASDFAVSTAQLGLAVGVLGAVVTALQLPLGYVSDTYSRRLVLGLSLVVGAIGCAMAALAPSFEWLLLAQVVMGIGVAGHHPAHYPLLSAATEESKRGRAYSVHGFTGAIGLAAPFAVVPLATLLGYDWRVAFGAVAAAGALYAVGCLAAFRSVPRHITHPPNHKPLPRPADISAGHLNGVAERVAGGVRAQVQGFRATPVIPVLTALWFVNSVAAWGVRTYAPTLLADGYGLDPATASLVGSAMLGVGALFILVGGYLTDGLGALTTMLTGYGVLVALAAGLATTALPLVLAVGAVLVLSSTVDVSRPARSMLTDAASARGDVGKNFALMTIGISAGGAVAPPVFGFLIERVGVDTAFYGVAATALVAFGLAVGVRAVGLGSATETAAAAD
ncbi:MFS transporter [Halorarius litoreus]|uniref:MFS transporter n=1 Tax=Halorarius litoreus TaxID=2962676 RepID=UPI0020CCF36D|nr:MFS transporter [Halorarius litoreus]